jgi:hypothetical protein
VGSDVPVLFSSPASANPSQIRAEEKQILTANRRIETNSGNKRRRRGGDGQDDGFGAVYIARVERSRVLDGLLFMG